MSNMLFHQPNIEITDFYLTETGTYQTMALRPFETTIGIDTLERLRESSGYGQSFGVAAVQDVAGQILHPSAQPQANVGIANGWQARRFRFMMRVVEKNEFSSGADVIRIFYGYTDNADASLNYLDPRMRIYFNSETVITTRAEQTPQGPILRKQIMGTNQIAGMVRPEEGVVPTNLDYSNTYMLRPHDVFGVGEVAITSQAINDSKLYGPVDITQSHYGPSMLNNSQTLDYVNRIDNTPARYLSRTMTGYHNAIREQHINREDNGIDQAVAYREAQQFTKNGSGSFKYNPFFTRLRNEVGYAQQGFVTYGDLCRLWPQLDGRVNFSKLDVRAARQEASAENSEHWRGSNNTTVAASMLSQIVPSIMMDNMLVMVTVTVLNGRGLGEYNIVVHGNEHQKIQLKFLEKGLDERTLIDEFRRRLAVDLLDTITHRNQLFISLSFQVTLTGDCNVTIDLDHEGMTRFTSATYADALYSPMLTLNRQHYSAMSNDLVYMLNEIIPMNHGNNDHMGQPTSYPSNESSTGQYGNDDYTNVL